jgi:hypothetical protein
LNSDLQIECVEEALEAGDAESPELASREIGDVGLLDTEEVRGLDLR